MPTDEEILAAVRNWDARNATYVIRNYLSSKGHKGLKTSWVLRQLKRLEREGKVVRVSSSYRVMITWGLSDRGV